MSKAWKLFVWEGDGVLQDYSSGMIVALGRDLQEALGAVRKSRDYCMQSFPNDSPSEVIEVGPGNKNTEAKAWTCYGGG